jgi:hypothetical protein
LGVRGNLAKYSYSEIFESMMAIYLTGGSRIEDAKRLSAQFSKKIAGIEAVQSRHDTENAVGQGR